MKSYRATFHGECDQLQALCESITDCHHSTPTYMPEGKLVIRNFNIKDGRMILGKVSFTDETHFQQRISRAKPLPGDLIITREAPMGEVCIIPDGVECCLGQRLVLIKPNLNKVDNKYLLYALLSEYTQIQIGKSNGTGSIVSNLRIPLLKELLIPAHELTMQKRIGNVLGAIDKKIELNNKINAELEVMAKLIYDYWFVQFDFPDTNGKAYKSSGGKMVYSEELKRDIPYGWEVKELQSIAHNIMGQSPKGDSYNKEGVGTPLLNGPADYKNGALYGRTYTTEPTRVCKKDDLVLCIRATIGNLVYSEKEFCLGRGVAAVRPNNASYSEFIYFIMIQEIERFKIQATGSIIKGITKDDLTESKCLIPDENLLLNFHRIIKPMFDKQRNNKTETLSLIELRDWLLPMLMNGQVTVKTK